MTKKVEKRTRLIPSELNNLQQILKLYPEGIVSVVCDTYDFWELVTETVPKLKSEILARNGKFVIRPDSSKKTPVEVLCGDPEAEVGSPEYKGLVELLWEIFGGEINSKGFKQLDPHIGAIYGDSITLEYQMQILYQLRAKGFSSTNIVLGIGSYTYQYVTRDTHGFAFKATAMQLIGEDKWIPIFKDPKTSSTQKKSAKGLLAVVQDAHHVRLVQNCEDNLDLFNSAENLLKPVVFEPFHVIKERVHNHTDTVVNDWFAEDEIKFLA